MTIDELRQYYANLLILQYIGQPNAYATIEALADLATMPMYTQEVLTFSGVAASGAFVINYNSFATPSLPWNSTTAQIQAALNAISGLENIIVSGSIATQNLAILFVYVDPPAANVTISSNTLEDGSSNPITINVTTPYVGDTSNTLPLALQAAFSIGTAVGPQLDIIGKYVGVSRTGNNFSGPVTLDDTDYTQLIRIAIVQNSSGSSLADIQSLLHIFFPGVITVFDYADMSMDYFFDAAIGSDTLAEFFIMGGHLPKPMGVQLGTLVYASPINNFFGARTMLVPPHNTHGFNTMVTYNFIVSSANATVGATYTNNGHTFTVTGTIAAGKFLITTGTGAPSSSGTLTKSGGTGDSTITFSAVNTGNPWLTMADGISV